MGRVRIGVLASLVVLGCGCRLAAADVASPSGPRLEMTETTHDFAPVSEGEEVRHVFSFRNAGSKPLTITPNRAPCRCRTVVGSRGTYAAGASGWIEVAFDTDEISGAYVRTATFVTNDPEHPELTLALRGTVVADVWVKPPKVFFGRVPRGVARERSVDLETAPGVTIKKVRRQSSRFKMRYERLASPRSGIRLHVELEPQIQLGPFHDELVVTTSGGREPTLTVPILGVVE